MLCCTTALLGLLPWMNCASWSRHNSPSRLPNLTKTRWMEPAWWPILPSNQELIQQITFIYCIYIYIYTDFYNIPCKRCFPNDEEYFGGLKKNTFKKILHGKMLPFPKKGDVFFSPGQTLPEGMMYSCICATPFQQLDVVSNAFSQIFSRSLSISPPPINTHFNLIMIDCNVIQVVVSNIFFIFKPWILRKMWTPVWLTHIFSTGLEKVLGCWGTKRWDGKPKKTFPQIFVHSTFWCLIFLVRMGSCWCPLLPRS